MENIFFLDLGGNVFGGDQSSPVFSNGLDSNLWLSNLQFRFIEYLEARVAVTNIIGKIGGNLETIPWYLPIKYNLFWNDLKNEVFIGTRKDRLKEIQNYQVNFVLRLEVIGGTEDHIYIGVKEEDVELAQEAASMFQVVEDRKGFVPSIDILFPNGYASHTAERILYRDIQAYSSEKVKVISVVFQISDSGDWVDAFGTEEAVNSYVAWLSETFDKIGVTIEEANR